MDVAGDLLLRRHGGLPGESRTCGRHPSLRFPVLPVVRRHCRPGVAQHASQRDSRGLPGDVAGHRRPEPSGTDLHRLRSFAARPDSGSPTDPATDFPLDPFHCERKYRNRRGPDDPPGLGGPQVQHSVSGAPGRQFAGPAAEPESVAGRWQRTALFPSERCCARSAGPCCPGLWDWRIWHLWSAAPPP